MSTVSHYDILEVSPKASTEVIRAAYKSLMQRNHPDKSRNLIESTARSASIAQAYTVLGNPERRLAYDETLLERLQAHELPGRLAQRSAVQNKSTTATRLGTWYAWVLILSIICAGGMILVLSKRKTAPEPNVQESSLSLPLTTETQVTGMAAGLTVPHALTTSPSGKTGESGAELQARTVFAFVTDLSIELSPTEPVPPHVAHVLHIPNMGLRFTTDEPERWTQRIQAQRSGLIRQLLTTLAQAQYDELIKVDGDLYLKKLITQTVSTAIGLESSSALPIVSAPTQTLPLPLEVLLPLSYSVR